MEELLRAREFAKQTPTRPKGRAESFRWQRVCASKLQRARKGALLLAGLVAGLAGTQSSCSLYRITVQQGNVITQDMVDRLKPGMTREQVAYIMGEPVVRNPFDQEQWDYVYTLEVPGRTERQRKLSLFFTDGVLSRLSGDFKPGAP